ncbi:MAG: phosphatase PAP2 family protein [Lachnospiraceae bacterium]|nr:phosphatase PAP2 family protein [Lachnospiraceae bacterium]
MQALKEHVIKTRRRLYILLYFPVYLLIFFFLDYRELPLSEYTIVGTKWDQYIPFCEYFVVFYYFWFFYIGLGVVLAYFEKDGKNYYRTCAYMFTGMTIFLLISALCPNRGFLRPVVFPRDNIFSYFVGLIYAVDTPTNLFPSIHVFNAIVVHISITNNSRFGNRPLVKWASLFVTVGIVLSTVFLKQHSIFDVLTGILMSVVLYVIVYHLGDQKFLARVGKYDKNMVVSE